jgi:hypothetical protein
MVQFVVKAVGGKRRIFNSLEICADKGFCKPLKTKNSPSLFP